MKTTDFERPSTTPSNSTPRPTLHFSVSRPRDHDLRPESSRLRWIPHTSRDQVQHLAIQHQDQYCISRSQDHDHELRPESSRPGWRPHTSRDQVQHLAIQHQDQHCISWSQDQDHELRPESSRPGWRPHTLGDQVQHLAIQHQDQHCISRSQDRDHDLETTSLDPELNSISFTWWSQSRPDVDVSITNCRRWCIVIGPHRTASSVSWWHWCWYCSTPVWQTHKAMEYVHSLRRVQTRKKWITNCRTQGCKKCHHNHRLNGSSSPVLTATSRSHWKGQHSTPIKSKPLNGF